MNEMEKQEKELKDFKTIYQWLCIARKPNFQLKDDLRLFMDLIQIPLSQDQLQVLQKIIDPKGIKQKLQEDDLVNCFIIPEQKKKIKEKEIQNAFKHVCEGQENISFDLLRECLQQQGLQKYSTELVLKQLGDFECENGKFDYKKFASWHCER